MALHLQKLSVGTESFESLAAWQQRMAQKRRSAGKPVEIQHVTRMFPREKDALLDGGSIYWVIKGFIQGRNEIIDLRETKTQDGRRACAIVMKPGLIPVIPMARRPFQGWRYLKADAAPADVTELNGGEELPAALRNRLVNLGAW